MKYHAHVYWHNAQERERALALRDSLDDLGCGLGRVMDRPIGPHPLPMYQVNFDHHQTESVKTLLTDQGLSVLLHEDTGDDVRDHTAGASWIGAVLPLDLEWLKTYSENKI